MLPLLHRKNDRSFLEGIQESMRRWESVMEQRESDTSLPMKPEVLARAVSDNLANDAIVMGDSGTSAMWVARDMRLREGQSFNVSGLLASMACGLPYAIGAQIAYPDRQVVAFVGDGGLTMLLGDLATLAKYNLPIKVVVLKNNVLGMIRWEQLMWVGNPEYGVELQDIDFVKIAEGFGLKALRAERPQDAQDIVAQALATPGPVLVEGVVDPYEPMMDGSVKPMQAQHIAQALSSGEVNVERVTRRMYQYAERDVPENRDEVMRALRENDAELLAAATRSAPGEGTEPATTFEEQRRTAPERESGSKA
jgi:pyruvate dehydrogenase (quinone)/pyruvate oxidase